MDPIQKAQLPSPFSFLSETFSFYKKNFTKFVWFLLLLGLFELIAPFIIQYFAALGRSTYSLWPLVIYFSLYILCLIIFTAVAAIFGVGLVKRILDIEKGSSVSFKDTLRSVLHIFWPIVFLSLLLTLIYIGSFSLLVIPGIVVIVYVFFSQIILIDQGTRGFKAIVESWQTVRGRWWGVFGRSLFVLLCSAILVLAFTIIINLIFRLFGIDLTSLSLGGPNGPLNYSALHPIAYTLFSLADLLFRDLLLAPLGIIYTIKVYRSLVGTRPVAAVSEKKVKGWMVAFLVVGSIVLAQLVFLFLSPIFHSNPVDQGQATVNSSGQTLYEDANGTFQITLAPGWTGAPSVAYPAATIFSNPDEDISEGVIVVAPISYSGAGIQATYPDPAIDAYVPTPQEQQAVAADAKTELATEGDTVVLSDLKTAPFYFEYTKPAGAEQDTSIHGREYLFFTQDMYFVIGAEASEDNWASSSPAILSMVRTFTPVVGH